MKSKKRAAKKQVGITVPEEIGLIDDIQKSLFEKVISLGIESYLELIEDDIALICGERYKHISDREFTRWSSIVTPVILGGRKIPVRHSRVRNIKDRKEKQIESITRYKDKELLSQRQMEQMIIGVSTRKYRRSLETGTIDAMEPYSDSKSTVSRNFILKTQEKLEAWRNEPIKEPYPFLMIDGIVYAKTTVLVALGIDKEGNKKALGAWEGSTENSRVCIDLIQSLVDRGFDVSACKLAIIDGGKALRKALDEVFGKDILIQRCQVHKKRNVADYLPKEKRETAKQAMSEAYNAENYDAAKKLMQNTIRWLDKDYPQAARSLEEGLEETLTLHKLKAHKQIRKSLGTTNPIESLNSGIRSVTRRVKRWRNSKMVIRWVCTGIIESEKNFRKINGHEHIYSLLTNIESFGGKVLAENKQVA
jgi:transposase-like protein